MAFPAADLGFFYFLVGLLAVSADLDLVRKEWKRALDFGAELHVLAGIRSQYGRHWAAAA